RWTATAQATLVRGGITDLGTLVLAPFEPRAGLIAAGGNPHRGTSLTDLGAHTLAIQQGGNVRAWGYNLFGQIGVGTQGTSARQYPSPVLVGLSGVRQVAVGGAISHSLALLEDHSLYAWGRNDHGQLGRGNTRNQNLPQPVPGTWMSITAGGSQTAGIDTEGALWRWGEYLGRGSDQTTPVLWNDTKRWAAAALGSRHLAAITTDGELWSWHEGTFGGATNGRRGQGTQWSFVTAGGRHSLAIQNDGSLWAWGDNEAGQLGNGTTTPTPEPVPVMEPGPWSFVVAGEDHSVAIKADGTLWTWGSNAGGQFGDGTRSGAIRPMNKLPGNEWVYAAAGYAYSLAVKADGTLCSWGSNGDGQLGVGNRIEQLFPQPVVSNARWWPSPAMNAQPMAP
ncbi:MAG: hypothetical protein JNK85_21960, partial [Verrucomicrobiales bacterium]|nr:hypothetical protein [Verrucomicrobiales bacterium]